MLWLFAFELLFTGSRRVSGDFNILPSCSSLGVTVLESPVVTTEDSQPILVENLNKKMVYEPFL